MSLLRKQAEALLCRFSSCTVTVVGDLMLDRFIYGSAERISPEAPVPVVHIKEERRMPGGAGNVACNIRALGGRAAVCGWIGRDAEGRELTRALRKQGIETAGVQTLGGGRTVVKLRVIAERQQVVRVDWDERPNPGPEEAKSFRASLGEVICQSNGLILEDYGKGVLSQETVNASLRAARKTGIPSGLDPKTNGLVFRGIRIATPNRREAFEGAGLEDPGPAENPLRDRALKRVGAVLLERWSCPCILITLGPKGMILFEPGRRPKHVPTRAREVFDVSGAGDTVIAANLLALSAGADLREAAELANYAAGVVVGKVGTATCSSEELLRAIPS